MPGTTRWACGPSARWSAGDDLKFGLKIIRAIMSAPRCSGSFLTLAVLGPISLTHAATRAGGAGVNRSAAGWPAFDRDLRALSEFEPRRHGAEPALPALDRNRVASHLAVSNSASIR